MISDSRKPDSARGLGTHDSGFVFRRIDARAVDAGLSLRFRAVVGVTGLPHAELADPTAADTTNNDDEQPPFALRALREFSSATGMPATTRVMIPGTGDALALLDATRKARINTRRVIVDLSPDRSRAEHLLRARSFSLAGFLVSTRLTPATLDVDFLLAVAADYIHITTPPSDFAAATDLRDVLGRVVRRKGRAIVGSIGSESEARRADAAGAGLTYGDFLAQARFLC